MIISLLFKGRCEIGRRERGDIGDRKGALVKDMSIVRLKPNNVQF